jgi:hypothetical protein
MTIRTALRTSSNRAAVQMLNGIGIKAPWGAERLNVGTPPSVRRCARRERCDADVADRRVWRVRRRWNRSNAGAHPRVEDSDGHALSRRGKSHRAVTESTAFSRRVCWLT